MIRGKVDGEPRSPLLTIAIPTYNRVSFLQLLLHTLLPQIQNRQEIELLISDNASSDGTQQFIQDLPREDLTLTYIRNSENIGADGNFLQCFEMARGRYFWLVGDDDVILPGALEDLLPWLYSRDYDLIHIASYPFHQDYRIPATSHRLPKPPREFAASSELAAFVHIFFTFISGNIVNKQSIKGIDHRPFSELLNSNLMQLGWTYTALRGTKIKLHITKPLIASKADNTGGYGLYTVFGAQFERITREWIDSTPTVNAILNGTIQRFFPSFLVSYRGARNGAFHHEDPHALLSLSYGQNFRYWFFLYPLIRFPLPFAKLWFQLDRVINRIDDVLGRPLIRGRRSWSTPVVGEK